MAEYKRSAAKEGTWLRKKNQNKVIENIYILIRICFKYVVGLKLAG
jgi:hypothetical protein